MSQSNKASIGTLNDLHAVWAKTMHKRIAEGTATAADFREAREFLKDNKVQQLELPGTPLHDLSKSLPFAGDESRH